MKFRACLCFGLLLFAPLSLTAGAEPPQLLFNSADVPQMRERSQATEWLRARRERLISAADVFLTTPTEPSEFIAQNLRGRLVWRYTGRLAKMRIETLAEAGYLTGDERYLLKARDILLRVIREYRPDDRNVWANHLQYSDATRVLSIGYDLIYPYLTSAERTEVRERIREYGHLLYTDDSTWGADADGVTSSNHNPIHFAALGLAALVLGDEPDWLARAVERVDAYATLFADETGYVMEGHSYLGYGQSAVVPFCIALKRATGRDLFAEHPIVKKINDQFVWMLMPFGGNIRTLNDSQNDAGAPATLYNSLLARDGVQLWAWLQASAHSLSEHKYPDELEESGDLLLMTPGVGPLEPVSPGAADWPLGKRYASGRVILRSAWDDPDAAHVVLTSGYDMHQGHNQQDENSVSFAALGEDFLTDPGYWPDASDSHTTLKINGVEQMIGSRGKILAYREDATGAFVRAQTQEAYPIVPSYVGLAERKLYFVRGPEPYLVWRDDAAIEIGDAAEVVARYVTDKNNQISARGDAAVIKGANGRGSCLLMVFSGDRALPVREENLVGRSYKVNSETSVFYTEYLKRLSAAVTAHHARLLTLVLPFREEAALPTTEVSYDRPRDTITCRLTFPDGRVDTLVFSATDAAFQRANPEQ